MLDSSRFADLEMDDDTTPATAPATTPATTTPATAPVRPVLEIDGIEAYDGSSDVSGAMQYPPAHKAMVDAGLNFNVALVQPEIPGFPLCPNREDHRAVLRTDTGRNFGFVSPSYGFVQPAELAALVDAALPSGAKVTVGGSTFGDHLWFNCSLPGGVFDVSPDAQLTADSMAQYGGKSHWIDGKTPITADLYFKHTYGGGGGYKVGLMLKALICGNGMRVDLKEGSKSLNIRHTAKFETRVGDLKRAFEVAGGAIPLYTGLFSEMASTAVTMAQFDQFAKTLFKGDSTQATNKRSALEKLYYEAPGAAPGTAWGALQAATNYATHHTPVRTGGRSASRYSLDMPADSAEIQNQARLESMMYGTAGALTNTALQYVSAHMLD